MNKSAQVTLFVILGIVLVIVAGLLIVASREGTNNSGPDDNEDITHDFSTIVELYSAGVRTCLKTTGEQSFKDVMARGGQADPAKAGVIALEEFPTKGTGLAIGGQSIPYWIYHTGSADCTNCLTKTNIPSLTKTTLSGSSQSIEEAVAQDMEKRIGACLATLAQHPDYDIQAEEYDVDVVIGEGIVNYELLGDTLFTYRVSEAKKTVSSFKTRQEASVKELYDIGVALAEELELNNETASLADAIRLIIQSYGLTSASELPPMYGPTEFETTGVRTWLLPEVRDRLQDNIADNLDLFQIRSADGQQLFYDENKYSESLYGGFALNPLLVLPHQDTLSQTEIDIVYNPDWTIDLSISPSAGGYLIRPESTQISPIPLLRFGWTDYRFVYNLQTPLLIVLHHKESFGGKGLTLVYGLETALIENKAKNYGSQQIRTSQRNLFSDLQQRIGVYNISTKDMLTGEELEGVEVNYVCGPDIAYIGESNEEGYLEEGLPFCIGGFLTAFKQGHHASPLPLTVTEHEYKNVELELSQDITFELAFKKRTLTKTQVGIAEYDWAVGESLGAIGPDIDILYAITKRSVPGEEELVFTGVINASSENPLVTLPVGEYDVNVMLLRQFGEGRTQQEFIIESYEECWDDTPLNIFDDDTCETIPEIRFEETMYVGGLLIDSTTQAQLTISPEHRANTKIEFISLEVPLESLQTHQDLEALNIVEGLQKNSGLFEPTLT